MPRPFMSLQDLGPRAEARWHRVLAERPDLAAAVALQRTLVTRIIEVGEKLGRRDAASWTLRPTDTAAKLARGVPMLRQESVPLPMPLLDPALREFCQDLARGGAGEAAAHIHTALTDGRINSGSLLAFSLARNRRVIRMGATQLGLAADLVWLVAELTVGPFAHLLQRDHLTGETAGPRVRTALANWDRGWCPACGSWPALAETRAGARDLRCSFCGAGWRLATVRCVYCGEAGAPFATTTPASDQPHRQLDLCDACRGYLKVVDTGDSTPFALLPIEDLATTGLDVAAMERGYARPSLPEREEEPDTTRPPSSPW